MRYGIHRVEMENKLVCRSKSIIAILDAFGQDLCLDSTFIRMFSFTLKPADLNFKILLLILLVFVYVMTRMPKKEQKNKISTQATSNGDFGI